MNKILLHKTKAKLFTQNILSIGYPGEDFEFNVKKWKREELYQISKDTLMK